MLTKTIHLDKFDLIQTHCVIEQLLQLCLQGAHPSPKRRCLAPIDTSNKRNTSPRVK